YDAFHSLFVVISSLKLAISWVTCVRFSPESCCAAGSCVIWLSVSRAAVRAALAASASTFGALGSWAAGAALVEGCAGAGAGLAGGCAGEDGSVGGWVVGEAG